MIPFRHGCPQCAASLRPDVVLFGDMMPEAFTQAMDASRHADLLLVVGSSLSVSPANTLAFYASRLAIINRDATSADSQAGLVIHGSAGEILTALLHELRI
jgi:NAD-dependent deacetylase